MHQCLCISSAQKILFYLLAPQEFEVFESLGFTLTFTSMSQRHNTVPAKWHDIAYLELKLYRISKTGASFLLREDGYDEGQTLLP